MLLACKDIHKAYGIDVILDKISFHIEEKEKAAIVGVNGAGKTTLFRIITGETSSDAGEVIVRKDATFGYMAQNAKAEGNRSIYDEMLHVFTPLLETEKRIREMEVEMAHVTGASLNKLMEEYAALQHSFEQQDGYGYKSRIKGVLKGLGFSEEEFDTPLTQLSGGQKTRVYLGRLLLTRPELLLLDEPTNHLDIASLQWLEDFLKSYDGAVLIISHDRYFMDRIVTKIIEIENKKSTVYEGNYSTFIQQKDLLRQAQLKQYTKQQQEIKHQEEVIKTLRSFNREKSIKRAESREKMLDKIERLDKPEGEPDKMRLMLTPKITSGNDVLYAENLSKRFDDMQLFQNVNLDVKREEKVAIVGPNGVGKSTLFKILLGELQSDSGQIRLGVNVHLGYYDQEQQALDESKTIFQEISDTYPNMTNGEIRNVLAAFVFTGDDTFKPIAALSGGEKGRVSLAKIMLSKANLLMLDEPTNHLDMYSKEILEDAINSYTGTVVYISHDRYFINRTAERVLELTPDGIKQYLGNYSYYLEKKAQEAADEAREVEQFASQNASETKNDWIKQKEEQARQRKLTNALEKLEKEINTAEEKIKALEEQLFESSVATDPQKAQDLFDEKSALEANLEELYEKWEELSES